MPDKKKKFYYVESVGLREVDDTNAMYYSAYDTPEEALIFFYKNTRAGKVNYIAELELKIKRRKAEIKKLDESFKYLKDSYPELFL